MNLSAQITEAEEVLKKQNNDTLEGWKTGGVFSASFTQVSLTNWAAGGQNAVSLNTILNVFANYKKGKMSWDNSLDLGYGFLQQGGQGVRKTDDNIDFTSKYGRKVYKDWYYAGLINFKSQMTAGYNYPNDSIVISNLLAPGYILGAIGMDFKPNKVFSMFLSPITTKMTIVRDQTLANAGAFGVDAAVKDTLGQIVAKGKMFRAEYGGYIRVILTKEIMENANLQTKLELFSNYANNPENIDINWEILVAMKVNKYLSATISTQLKYDDDIEIAVDRNNDGKIDGMGQRLQIKEVLGIGLTVKF